MRGIAFWNLLLQWEQQNLFCFVARTSTGLSKRQARMYTFVNSAVFLLACKKKAVKIIIRHSCVHTPDSPV